MLYWQSRYLELLEYKIPVLKDKFKYLNNISLVKPQGNFKELHPLSQLTAVGLEGYQLWLGLHSQ